MKITKEQIEEIIKEEIDAVLSESYGKYGTGEDRTARMKRQQQMKPKTAEAPYENNLPPFEILQAKIIIGVLDKNSNTKDIAVPQETYDYISQNREDLLDRVFVK